MFFHQIFKHQFLTWVKFFSPDSAVDNAADKEFCWKKFYSW